MSELDDRVRAAARACTRTVVWHPRVGPAETYAALAAACTEFGIEDWDGYGSGGAVTLLEEETAALLGKPAAAFFVSGVMAQQAALRTWCDRRGSLRVATPDRAHQLAHEDDGPRLLHGFRFEHLTTGMRTVVPADLRDLPGAAGLGAVQLELPLREAGCLLPSWSELSSFSELARSLGVPLHVDGARLWESQPFYDRPLSEIADLFDTVYVSYYKGLGAMAGAVVAGPADVVAEIRRWRRRMGGALYHLSPYAVGALAGLRTHQPRMASYVGWARRLGAELAERGIRTTPVHTNTFLAYAAAADPDAVALRLAEFMEKTGVLLCNGWGPSAVPGVLSTEVTIHGGALDFDPAEVAGWYADLFA